MQLTVYIPFKNPDTDLLREVLAAIARQSTQADELLLIDDGSDDGVLEAEMLANPRIRVIRHAQNMGVAAARNTALKHAQGSFIASFDADIVPDDNCLTQLLTILLSDSRIAGVGGRVREKYTHSLGDRFRQEFMKQDRGEDRIDEIDLFGGCTIYKTEILKKVGGYFSPLRNSFEDFDISRRVRQAGGMTVYHPLAHAYHHKQDTVISALDTLYRWSYPHWESSSWEQSYDWLSNPQAHIPPKDYYEKIVCSSLKHLGYKAQQDFAINSGRMTGISTDRELSLLLVVFAARGIMNDIHTWVTMHSEGHSLVESRQVQMYINRFLVWMLFSALPVTLVKQNLSLLLWQPTDRFDEQVLIEASFDEIIATVPENTLKKPLELYLEQVLVGMADLIKQFSSLS